MEDERADSRRGAEGNARSAPVHWLTLAALCGLHVLLVGYFLPFGLALGDDPVTGFDLGIHLAQNARFAEAMAGWGEPWSYDVRLLAGHPACVIFDADNKAWELWVYLGMKMGLSFGRAANSFILSVHLLVPAVVYVSARMFRVGRGAALVATFLGSALWFFDSFVHFGWWVGMVEYMFSGYLVLLPLAFFFRFTEGRRRRQAIVAGVLLGVVLLVHPYTFIMLVAPMTFLWLRDWGSRNWKDHVWVFVVAGIAIALNVWWLRVALEFWHYVMDSAFYGQTGLRFLLADFSSTLLDAETTGHVSTRSGFRMVTWLAGGLMAAIWWRAGDVRGRAFAVAIGTMLGLAYLGSYVGVFAQVQPYRFVMPAAYLAAVPAGAMCVHLAKGLRRGDLGRTGKTIAIVLALPALQHFLSDMLYFMPDLQPPLPKLSDGREVPASGTGFARHRKLSYDNHLPEHEIGEWVKANIDDRSRVLVEWPALGDELAWRTDAQILGGFSFRNLQHSWANLYRRDSTGNVSAEDLRRYLETYAVGWVILTTDYRWFGSGLNPLLHPVARIGRHSVYRTQLDVDLVREGGGVVHAKVNRIQVQGSTPDEDSVLRYHWLETLVCRPDCTVERTEVDGVDPVGFIRVPAPHPADFEIVNGY